MQRRLNTGDEDNVREPESQQEVRMCNRRSYLFAAPCAKGI